MLRLQLVVLLVLLPLVAPAEPLPVADGITLHLDLPGVDWSFHRDPPQFLVDETVAHVRHHLAEDGREVPDDLAAQVLQRMRQNELFMVRATTAARLLVDFSPDPEGQPAPDPGTVEQSARLAAAELENEPDLSAVQSLVSPAEFRGAGRVWEVSASYLQDGEPRRFLGVIGHVAGHWMFLYYTDLARDPGDLPALQSSLGAAWIETH